MRNDIRQSNLELGPKLIERYIDRAHRLRREYIRSSVRRSFAGLRRGVQRSLVRMGGAFRRTAGDATRARRAR